MHGRNADAGLARGEPSTAHASARVEGIDVARGLAGLIMIGGHATHAWTSPEAKDTVAYGVTRLFATLPLPAFLVLAGAAVAWRVDAAARRGEDSVDVRRRVAWRGIQIVLWGYAVSALYALVDGTRGIESLLRADVLHVIGLSIAAVAWLGIRPSRARGVRARLARHAARTAEGPPDPARLLYTTLVLGVAVTIACPFIASAAPATTGPLRFAVALFADVPGITLMPFVPLAAWLCAGVGAATLMLRARDRVGDRSPSGAPTGTLVALAAAALAVSLVTAPLTPTGITRADPAVWLNVADLAARGVLVLAAGALLARAVRGRTRTALLRLGRGSLVAYVFHIPFCYGVLGTPLAERLTVPEALLAATALAAASYLAVHARDLFPWGVAPRQHAGRALTRR